MKSFTDLWAGQEQRKGRHSVLGLLGIEATGQGLLRAGLWPPKRVRRRARPQHLRMGLYWERGY